jgi:ABC-type spermidine/putrescine transport system permease subunit I
MDYARGAYIFPQINNHPKILGVRKVIWSKFETENPHVLGEAVKNLFPMATFRPGFIYHWLTQHASQ